MGDVVQFRRRQRGEVTSSELGKLLGITLAAGVVFWAGTLFYLVQFGRWLWSLWG